MPRPRSCRNSCANFTSAWCSRRRHRPVEGRTITGATTITLRDQLRARWTTTFKYMLVGLAIIVAGITSFQMSSGFFAWGLGNRARDICDPPHERFVRLILCSHYRCRHIDFRASARQGPARHVLFVQFGWNVLARSHGLGGHLALEGDEAHTRRQTSISHSHKTDGRAVCSQTSLLSGAMSRLCACS